LYTEPALKVSFPDGNRDLVLHYLSHMLNGSHVSVLLKDISRDVWVELRYDTDQQHGRGFEIAASDGKFRWAQARKAGHDIVVFNDAVSQPVAVRYDWSNTPDGNVYNKESLPALPFRTDAPKH
jgi:hypothetical protein